MIGNGPFSKDKLAALAAQAAQTQQPQMMLSTPINDTQLVAMVSMFVEGTPRERVRLAMEILAEAIMQMRDFPALVQQKSAAEAAR